MLTKLKDEKEPACELPGKGILSRGDMCKGPEVGKRPLKSTEEASVERVKSVRIQGHTRSGWALQAVGMRWDLS